MTRSPSPKRKSQKRFEQFNRLVDVVLPSMPANKGPHRTAMLVFFRHAGPTGGFKFTAGKLALTLGVQDRHARRIIGDLRRWGLIEHSPTKDTPTAKAHRITFRRYEETTTTTRD